MGRGVGETPGREARGAEVGGGSGRRERQRDGQAVVGGDVHVAGDAGRPAIVATTRWWPMLTSSGCSSGVLPDGLVVDASGRRRSGRWSPPRARRGAAARRGCPRPRSACASPGPPRRRTREGRERARVVLELVLRLADVVEDAGVGCDRVRALELDERRRGSRPRRRARRRAGSAAEAWCGRRWRPRRGGAPARAESAAYRTGRSVRRSASWYVRRGHSS